MKESIKISEGTVILKVNPKVYPLDAVYSAAYVLLDKAYILLDGDPEKEVIVQLKPKGSEDLEKFGMEFFNELINYADYQRRSEQTRKVREMILQRALFTNDPESVQSTANDSLSLADVGLEDDGIEDPEGIAIPWEEKYGKEQKTPKSKSKDGKKNKTKPKQ